MEELKMAYTVSLLSDHKGISGRKVMGDEYVVDAAVVITAYAAADRISASDVGLSTISAVSITGNSQPTIYTVDIAATDSTGAYASTSTFKIFLMDNADANEVEEGDGDITDTTIRVRVWGNL